ncbi:transposable element Tcb1 transposase [Trichonephila clavipes]|uniref:Transposable element Tcb1 transposase n=1 Tax=Trichonephila clavipes TaxID=2585209 RepID=A0A8X6SQ67_TRICX|nr:transposable element Tcb1 transposase [Trichonephila clavipes]
MKYPPDAQAITGSCPISQQTRILGASFCSRDKTSRQIHSRVWVGKGWTPKCTLSFPVTSHVKILERKDSGLLRDCGLSFGEIGSRVGRNQATVLRICDRWMQEGTTDRRGRWHPPQYTTSREYRQIVRMAVIYKINFVVLSLAFLLVLHLRWPALYLHTHGTT